MLSTDVYLRMKYTPYIPPFLFFSRKGMSQENKNGYSKGVKEVQWHRHHDINSGEGWNYPFRHSSIPEYAPSPSSRSSRRYAPAAAAAWLAPPICLSPDRASLFLDRVRIRLPLPPPPPPPLYARCHQDVRRSLRRRRAPTRYCPTPPSLLFPVRCAKPSSQTLTSSYSAI